MHFCFIKINRRRDTSTWRGLYTLSVLSALFRLMSSFSLWSISVLSSLELELFIVTISHTNKKNAAKKGATRYKKPSMCVIPCSLWTYIINMSFSLFPIWGIIRSWGLWEHLKLDSVPCSSTRVWTWVVSWSQNSTSHIQGVVLWQLIHRFFRVPFLLVETGKWPWVGGLCGPLSMKQNQYYYLQHQKHHLQWKGH